MRGEDGGVGSLARGLVRMLLRQGSEAARKGQTIGAGLDKTRESQEPSAEAEWCVRWPRWIGAVVVGYAILWWLGPSLTSEALRRARLYQVLIMLLFLLVGSVAGFLAGTVGRRGSPVYPALLAGACITGALCCRLAEHAWSPGPAADALFGIATAFGVLFWVTLVPYAGGLALGGLLAAAIPADWLRDE